jgi:hypothetical protein
MHVIRQDSTVVVGNRSTYFLLSNKHLGKKPILHLLLHTRAHAQDIDIQYSHIEYFEYLDGDFQVIHTVMIQATGKTRFPKPWNE